MRSYVASRHAGLVCQRGSGKHSCRVPILRKTATSKLFTQLSAVQREQLQEEDVQQPSTSRTDDFFIPGQEASSRQQLFDNISPVYDQLNDGLSLGLHRVWKRMAVKWSRAKPKDKVLDICCGSGDLSFILAEVVGHNGQVIILTVLFILCLG